MKNVIIALVCFGFMGLAHAEEAKKEDHTAHHPEGQATETKKEGMGGMGKMDMHAMMGECMKKHKDGKMCNHEMMGKCEQQMSKDECMKMMNETKAESKKTKK